MSPLQVHSVTEWQQSINGVSLQLQQINNKQCIQPPSPHIYIKKTVDQYKGAFSCSENDEQLPSNIDLFIVFWMNSRESPPCCCHAGVEQAMCSWFPQERLGKSLGHRVYRQKATPEPAHVLDEPHRGTVTLPGSGSRKTFEESVCNNND